MQRTLRTVRSAPSSLRAQYLHSSASVPNPSHVLNKTGSNYNRLTVDNLRSECRKRGLKVSGNKNHLVDRLTMDDSAASFSTVVSPKRKPAAAPPLPAQPKSFSSLSPATPVTHKKTVHSTVTEAVRSIQTTPAAEAKNDSSTIDYFELPVLAFDVAEPAKAAIPVVPTNYTVRTKIPESTPVARPEIAHVSGDTEVLPIQDGVEEDYASGSQEISSRDKIVLTSIFAGTLAWWGIGSIASKKKDH